MKLQRAYKFLGPNISLDTNEKKDISKLII
jgi:hypothetical protein